MTVPRRDERGRILVDSAAEVPHFATDAECAAYWESHTPSEAYLHAHRLPPDDPRLQRLRARLGLRAEQRQGD